MTESITPLDPDVVTFLAGLKRRGVSLGLRRMRHFAAALGNPQDRLPVLHIAGTNGKGSTAAMLEAILRAAGWKVGLYTSPHLVRLGERIQVDRAPIGNAELERYVRELRRVVDAVVAAEGPDAAPSYFEFMTALAWVHFVRTGCAIAVVEVGLGGRLDATNVVTPEVSVITSIGLDHCEFLGTTLAAIAGEKAGIIKPGRPVVMGALPLEAEHVVRAVAAVQGSPVFSVRESFGRDVARYPRTRLAGEYQRTNAATATLAARQLAPRWRLTEALIAGSVATVDWPGRWQQLEVGGRHVIVDASHNEEGAQALDQCLGQLATGAARAPAVVVGVLGVGRAKPILEVVGRRAAEIYLVVPQQRRACSHEELERLLPATFSGRVTRTTLEVLFPAPGHCSIEGCHDVVVTGSLYLAGEALARIVPARGPVEHELQDF